MSASFNGRTTCERLPNDELCEGCGWKCDCVRCTTNDSGGSIDCQCVCRFWIVVCFVVALGFMAVFFTSILYKRRMLCVISSIAFLLAGSFSTLAILTDDCLWPAFFSVTLIFVFPCFYSCCRSYHSRRREAPVVARLDPVIVAEEEEGESETDKLPPAVFIQSPDGEFQIGMEVEMEEINTQRPDQNQDVPIAGSSVSSSVCLDHLMDSRRPLNPT